MILSMEQAGYNWKNTTDNLIIYDTQNTVLNSYHGGAFHNVPVLFSQLIHGRRLSANNQWPSGHGPELLRARDWVFLCLRL
jgi:hypothetical protein